MGRDIRIEEVDNGYILRAFEVKDGQLHFEPTKETVATSKSEVAAFFQAWLDKQAPPFKKES